MNILHPEDAKILGCPEDVEDCQGLPVVITDDRRMVSFWQPDAYEIEALARGGSIALSVKGPHPLVSIMVDEYPGTLATEPEDVALDRAVERIGAYTQPERDYFKAGARWQKARPVSIKFRPLEWLNPEPHIHVCRDETTHQAFVLSEHDGVVYYGKDPIPDFKTGKAMDEMKEVIQTVRNSRLMAAIDIEALLT